MKKLTLLLLLLISVTIFTKTFAQNIAVNQTGNLPDTSAMLDVSSTNKGFLAPRMTTAQQNAIPLPAKGLLIFNTTDNGFKVNTGTTESPVWTALATGSGATTNLLSSSDNTISSTVNGVAATAPAINSNDLSLSGTNLTSTINGIGSNQLDISPAINANSWALTGNSSTSAGTNFVGTTDAVDFIAKTNNTERLRVTSGGNVGINNASPIARFDVRTSTSDISNGITNAVTVNSTTTSVVGIDNNIGFNSGSTVSSTVSATAVRATVNGTPSQSYGTLTGIYARIAMNGATSATSAYGINIGSPGGGAAITSLIGINIRDQSGGASNYNLTLGPSGVPADAGNFSIYNSSNKTNYFAGNLGIGTTSPGSALDVKGTFRLSGATSGYVGFTPAAAAGSTTYTLPSADGTAGFQLSTNGAGVLSWTAGGIGTLNGLTGGTQTFATGTSGSDFNIASSGTAHTFNIPDASATARGAVSTGTQTIAGNKTLTGATTVSGALTASNTVNLTAITTGATTDSLLTINAATGKVNRRTVANVLSSATSNTLSSAVNTITSTVNGVAATAPAVNSVSNTSSVNSLTTTINGVAGSTVNIINSNATSLSGTNLTTTVNGVAATALNLTPAITAIAWSRTGNSGTNSSTNFIGTTDAVEFVTRTNNTERMRINSAGNVGIATTNPLTTFHNNGGTWLGLQSGTASSSLGTNITNIFSPTQITSNATATAPETALRLIRPGTFVDKWNATFDLKIGDATVGSSATNTQMDFVLGFGSAQTPNTTVMTMLGSGRVGIGTTTPGSTLDVKGALRLSGATSGYVGLQPAAAAGSTTYTLPSADGTSGQQLTTNGSGTLSWAAAGSTSGTVTSVGLTSTDITVGGSSPITTSGTYTLTLPTVNSNVGSFTNANITVNAKGQITAASSGSAGSGWLLTGNTGITQPVAPATYGSSALGASENFLGTKDARDLVFGSNNLERMRILNSNGYLGIGTAAPSKPIDLVQNLSGAGLVKIQNTSTSGYSSIDIWSNTTQIGNIGFSNAGAVYPNAFYFATNTTNSMVFATNNVERLRLDGSTGYFGVNTTTPNSTIEINGSLAYDLTSSNSSSTVTLDNTSTVYYLTGSGSVSLPSASSCPNRLYIIVNRTSSSKSISSFTSISGSGTTSIAANSSIEIISNGSNWLQIK